MLKWEVGNPASTGLIKTTLKVIKSKKLDHQSKTNNIKKHIN